MVFHFQGKVKHLREGEDHRLEALFTTRPAYFWLPPSSEALRSKLREAAASEAEVEIEWDAATGEIMAINLNQG